MAVWCLHTQLTIKKLESQNKKKRQKTSEISLVLWNNIVYTETTVIREIREKYGGLEGNKTEYSSMAKSVVVILHRVVLKCCINLLSFFQNFE